MKTLAAPFGLAGLGSGRETDRSNAQFFDWRVAGIGLLIAAGYYIGAKIGFALTFKPHPVSVLWPPNSILLAGLLLTRKSAWWILLLAAFLAHWLVQLQSDVPPLMIFCWFISNSCEALIGATFIRYFIGRPVRFDRLRNVTLFCLGGGFLGPFLSSFLDSGFVALNDWGAGSYWEIWRIRFASNVLAALTLTPLIVSWATQRIAFWRNVPRGRFLEGSCLLLGLLVTNFVLVNQIASASDSALLYLPFPFLLWAAVRFGAFGASTAVSAIAFSAIWSAAHGHGPFSAGSAEENALSIQIFLIVLSVPMLFLAAVTEERATGETELRESESRFRIVADSAPVLIWMADVDKLCTFFNKPWLDFTGRAVEPEMGNGWANGVHRDDLQQCLQTYTAAFDAREPFTIQYRLRRHDGEYRWISDHGVPRYDAEQRFAGYIGSCVDVTESINKERALKESEERMRLAAEAANLGMWEWNLESDEIWATPARRAVLGWPSSGKLTLEDFISSVHVDDRGRVREKLKEAAEQGKDYDTEYRVVLPTGGVQWIAARGKIQVDARGKPKRIMGVGIDITERKQAELEARQRHDDLGHLGRVALMGEMSASLAHELNQPLSAIVSNASAGQRFIARGNVDLNELRDLLADISADGWRAGEVLRGIRNMVKKGEITRQQVNLNDIVMNVVQLVTTDALLHSCELQTALDPDLPVVDADPIQIQQILLNLIVNAFDAMSDTPASIRKVVIATERDGSGSVCTSVRDYGSGISEEARQRVFEQFFTTKPEGLGMGLSIVRSMVESHAGSIAAENASGGGARFCFKLPTEAAV